jgi:TPR repeat protein
MYENGQGVAQDYAEAVRLYKQSAAQEHTRAQYNLALMLQAGKGVAQDYAEATRLFRLAATQGLSVAQGNLALSYAQGLGVPQNFIRAHMWANLAASTGDSVAFRTRDLMSEQLTNQQIAEAQKLARECQARNFKNCD